MAMAFCTKCGTQISEATRFCPSCGQEQSGLKPAQPSPTSSASHNPGPSAPHHSGSGLSENLAALLSYSLGWLTGLIFYFLDRRPYVRFHAAQSMVLFGGIHIIRILLAAVFGFGWWMGGMHGWSHMGAAAPLFAVIGIVSFVLWIVCMVKAYRGERFKIPVAGDIAQGLAR